MVKKRINQSYTPAELDLAKELIRSGQASFVIMHAGLIAGEAKGMGVKPILLFLENEPHSLKGAEVADRAIGKAAAMLLVLGGVQYVYGEIMSLSGRDYLEEAGITFSYGSLVEWINNRDGSDICPLERSVIKTDDPQEGYAAIKEALDRLKR